MIKPELSIKFATQMSMKMGQLICSLRLCHLGLCLMVSNTEFCVNHECQTQAAEKCQCQAKCLMSNTLLDVKESI